MSSPIEEVMKEVGLSESSKSSRESTDSELCLISQITAMGIIDLDPNFGSGPLTVVVDDILEGVDQILVWNLGVCRAEAALVDKAGRLAGR
ncbi:hypothetical protein ACOSQ3_018616 [Xanthoceras sorbifolium]